jgi:hypothetical protein
MNEIELLKIAAILTNGFARNDNLTMTDYLKNFDTFHNHLLKKINDETNQTEKPAI